MPAKDASACAADLQTTRREALTSNDTPLLDYLGTDSAQPSSEPGLSIAHVVVIQVSAAWITRCGQALAHLPLLPQHTDTRFNCVYERLCLVATVWAAAATFVLESRPGCANAGTVSSGGRSVEVKHGSD